LQRQENTFDCGQYFSYTVFSEALGAGGGYCGSQRNEISRGHNDTLAGLVVVNDEELAERIKLIQKSEGPYCLLLTAG